jgi:predicted RNA methylase
MPVGYDTLELMSLLAALEAPQESRLLDLCCGCGIQGIFAILCNPGAFHELVCSDINKRACHFAAANVALNIRDKNNTSYSVKGDVYENVTGIFGCIVSNPPFVAMPSNTTNPQLASALYTVGGGVDGTELFQRVVQESIQYLQGDDALLLAVTELPNIETSCTLVKSFLPEKTTASIRVAYVGRDVETVQRYAAIRQAETPVDIDARDWETAQLESGMYNRALALVSISSIGRGNRMTLHQYEDHSTSDIESESSNELDEEDAFLTKEGIAFTRTCLL